MSCGSSQGPVPGIGCVFETVFESNPKAGSTYRFRATRMDGKRSPKVILCNDARIQPGRPCRVRVVSVKKPACKNRGWIEVVYLCLAHPGLGDGYYIEPVLLKKIQAVIDSGRNILLDGPQGCGKNELSRLLAETMGYEFVYFNCSSVYEATDFVASIQVRANGSGPAETVWVTTDVYRALVAAKEEPSRRFLILLDEFNRCREMARNGILPALDATRRLFNPMTGSTIPIPDNTLWVAAINNGAQFTGTSTVDPAQLDRFSPIKMSYPPVKEEVRLLRARYPKAKPADVARVVKAADAVRRDAGLRVDLSMRATEEVCLLLEHPHFAEFVGDAVAELIKTSFCGRFAGTWDDTTTDAGRVWQVVVRALEL